MGEGIRSGEELAGNMDHSEGEVGEVNKPACLLSIKQLRLMKVREVLVISENLQWEGRAMKVVVPRFQGADDHEEFPVINVVVSFGRRERLGKVGAGMPVPVGISLKKDGARCVF